MRCQVIGIEHMEGDFTPTNGKNSGLVQHYDLYRIHAIKNSKIVGGKECVVIRVKPDQMGDIIAEVGGLIDDVVNHVFDMDVRSGFGKINLVDWELVQ